MPDPTNRPRRQVSLRRPKIQPYGVVTAHLLYDVVACEHRIHLDVFSDAIPGDVNPFVELLWRRESNYTTDVYGRMRAEAAGSLDLSKLQDYGVRTNRTIEALRSHVPMILGGVLDVENLRAAPNFLVLDGGRYRVGIIKSGRGKEQHTGEPGRDYEEVLKDHYAVELALSVDALKRLNVLVSRIGTVYDVDGNSVSYDLDESRTSTSTFWSWYEEKKERVVSILSGAPTDPAFMSICKLCHWYHHCLDDMMKRDDITLVPELGRRRREILQYAFATRTALAAGEVSEFHSVVSEEDRKRRLTIRLFSLFLARAKLYVASGHPYLTNDNLNLHLTDQDEIFFDVETDPMRDVCYLHGFAERLRGRQDFTYTSFFADPDEEWRVFKEAVEYLRSRPEHVIYHYSPYEKTIYRRLQSRYRNVCSEEDVEGFFAKRRCVDLYYDVVFGQSIWPTIDHSLKTLAKSEFVGFKWADPNPSGAASVEWFDRWMTEHDPALKARILAYNEDDCVGMAWLLDAIRKFPIRSLGTLPMPRNVIQYLSE